jgi:O-methyltransferase
MSASDLGQLLARSLAIALFAAAAKVPALASVLPGARLRRLVATAGLPDLKYGGIFTRSSYTPWKGDADFRKVHAVVRGNTLVDEARCHELWQLCGQLGTLEPGDLLEVGVWRGGTGCLMARRLQDLGAGGRVHLCDTFAGVVKAGGQDSAYVGGEHADTSTGVVRDLMQALALGNVDIRPGMFPDDTGAAIADRRFRLCHIDVDVYESAAQTFDWVWPRLVPGGIVVFDDYGFYSCSGVTRLVDRMRGMPDRLVVYNVNGHALVVKRTA